MTYISKKDTQRILEASTGRLLDVITANASVRRKGKSYEGTCPSCGDEKKFSFDPNKNIFKCWKCDFAGNVPVAFWMKQGKSYPEALRLLANQFNVMLEEPKPVKAFSRPGGKSYCVRMLKESGLTPEDVQSKVFHSDENHTTTTSRTFYAGTTNQRNEIVEGDDVIIEYFDLDGAPVQYEQKRKGQGTGKMLDYFRVRWQFPEEHKDKNGKPFKYKSPAGSGSFVYIPQWIRSKYKKGEKIERLFIQEGEKKAEKACKHNIPSVAISGIHNLGRNGHLHEDLVKLVSACEVKEIVLLFDADVYDLSRNIGLNDAADQRPRSFFYAARNFKEYCVQLRNSRSLYLEIYIGHVQPNEKQDKGIDDLLTNSLKGNEDAISQDIDTLINNRDLTGKYLQLHKITSWSDAKIMDLWSLNNSYDFAQRHKAVLSQLPEFRIGRYRWRFNDDGEVESTQPIEHDEQYWEEVQKKNRDGEVISIDYKFRYERCFRFLQNRGFGRFRLPSQDYAYIRIEHPFVDTVHHHEEIRDFVKSFTREIANEEVLEMLHRGGPQFLGPEKLSNLRIIEPTFEQPARNRQLFYFKERFWEVSKNDIVEKEYSNITHQIWRDQVHTIDAQRTNRLINVSVNDKGVYSYSLSAEGRKCDYLQFLINASNFTWRKERNNIDIDDDEINENRQHLVSKLCAIGYMMLSAKDQSVAKAVVAMDGKQSEVGDSNGRSGKSLLGNLFEEVKSTVYINGKHQNIEGDGFLWNDVDVKTQVVFIDDLRTNFSLEFLFANITGNWTVNYKSGPRFTFPFNTSPKLFLTTNHALNGEGSSYADRQWVIAFSDYYNDTHKPIDDFGTLFFDDWDFQQWNLTWNLLAECVQLYLRFGVVEAPGERIAQRKLRQFMGESFISWAEEYFSREENLNAPIIRKDMQDAFFEYEPTQRKYTTSSRFKQKILKYCEWKGYLFNPHKYDPQSGMPFNTDKDGRPDVTDKSAGVEYFMIGTPGEFRAVAENLLDKEDLPFDVGEREF